MTSQFRSVHDGIYAFDKAHVCSKTSLRSSPRCCLSNSCLVLPISFFSSLQGRSSSVSSFCASVLQAIDDTISLTLGPQVVSEAPLRSSVWAHRLYAKGLLTGAWRSIVSIFCLEYIFVWTKLLYASDILRREALAAAASPVCLSGRSCLCPWFAQAQATATVLSVTSH